MLAAAPLATRTDAKWGLPMTELPSGRFDLVEGDRQPEVLQSLQEQLVLRSDRSRRSRSSSDCSGPFAGLDEVGERVHRPRRERARDLAARHEPDAEALGAGLSLDNAGEPVVVGERYRSATCGHGELHDSLGSL